MVVPRSCVSYPQSQVGDDDEEEQAEEEEADEDKAGEKEGRRRI